MIHIISKAGRPETLPRWEQWFTIVIKDLALIPSGIDFPQAYSGMAEEGCNGSGHLVLCNSILM
jgi:hypothetical protein